MVLRERSNEDKKDPLRRIGRGGAFDSRGLSGKEFERMLEKANEIMRIETKNVIYDEKRLSALIEGLSDIALSKERVRIDRKLAKKVGEALYSLEKGDKATAEGCEAIYEALCAAYYAFEFGAYEAGVHKKDASQLIKKIESVRPKLVEFIHESLGGVGKRALPLSIEEAEELVKKNAKKLGEKKSKATTAALDALELLADCLRNICDEEATSLLL
ncbi:MAG: hypothetical protein N3E51_01720 [Candidatus Micrarchaeota archaeon]|nr:hypothetical protein [Candidatus Micrarchaeota archaeon]